MNKLNKHGFLFDLDGVLIDSEKEYTRIWKEINATFPTGIKNFELQIKGTTLNNILATYYPDNEIRENVKYLLDSLEEKMKFEYKEGAKDFLDSLQNRNIPTALVTSSNNKKMQKLHSSLPELIDSFNTVITAEKITNSKPDPEGYLLAAKTINCEIKNCCVFEDSLQGVKAGKNSGAYVIGVTGTIPDEDLKKFSDMLINNFYEIDIDSILENFEEND